MLPLELFYWQNVTQAEAKTGKIKNKMVKITVRPCSVMHTSNNTSRNPLESDVSQPVSHLNINYFCTYRYHERNLLIDGIDDLHDRVACQLLNVTVLIFLFKMLDGL